ncbi:MAG: hypothetical protein NZT61_05260 [Deltaproteobacteria bacterium]|nr:hypothetical protein [Deltaproteobacteria bacterium]
MKHVLTLSNKSRKKGFAAFWAMLVAFPAVLIFTSFVNIYLQDFQVREEAFHVAQQVKSVLRSFGSTDDLFSFLRREYGSRFSVQQNDISKSAFTINFGRKIVQFTIDRRPRNAVIVLGGGEYVAPLKHVHLDPEVWLREINGFSTFRNVVAISSNRNRDSGEYHFVDKPVDQFPYWSGPRVFARLNSALWEPVRTRINNKRYPSSVINRCSTPINSRTCRFSQEDICQECPLRSLCDNIRSCSEKRECMRKAYEDCVKRSLVGLATYHGQGCSNPNFTAMKVLATNLWYYYSSDPRNRILVLSGPADYFPQGGWDNNRKGKPYPLFRFKDTPHPIAKARGTIIQNATDVERGPIDQDCVLSLYNDVRDFLRRKQAGMPTNLSSEPHYFIPQPLPLLVVRNLSERDRLTFMHGVRQMPALAFDTEDGRRVLKRRYIEQLTVPEAIFSQVAKQRHFQFDLIADYIADEIKSISNKPLDIFFILGDFPWFTLGDRYRSHADEVDCARSVTNVFGFLKVERTFDRGRVGQQAVLRPQVVCENFNVNRALNYYFNRLEENLREINNAIKGSVKANVFFIIPRTEGSYPSHKNEEFNCSSVRCRSFGDESIRFASFLNNKRKSFNKLNVVLIPVNDPGTLAYELSVLLPHFIESQRVSARIS